MACGWCHPVSITDEHRSPGIGPGLKLPILITLPHRLTPSFSATLPPSLVICEFVECWCLHACACVVGWDVFAVSWVTAPLVCRLAYHSTCCTLLCDTVSLSVHLVRSYVTAMQRRRPLRMTLACSDVSHADDDPRDQLSFRDLLRGWGMEEGEEERGGVGRGLRFV